MTQITISLPEYLILKGKTYAKISGRTFSGLLRLGLEKQLEDNNESS